MCLFDTYCGMPNSSVVLFKRFDTHSQRSTGEWLSFRGLMRFMYTHSERSTVQWLSFRGWMYFFDTQRFNRSVVSVYRFDVFHRYTLRNDRTRIKRIAVWNPFLFSAHLVLIKSIKGLWYRLILIDKAGKKNEIQWVSRILFWTGLTSDKSKNCLPMCFYFVTSPNYLRHSLLIIAFQLCFLLKREQTPYFHLLSFYFGLFCDSVHFLIFFVFFIYLSWIGDILFSVTYPYKRY